MPTTPISFTAHDRRVRGDGGEQRIDQRRAEGYDPHRQTARPLSPLAGAGSRPIPAWPRCCWGEEPVDLFGDDVAMHRLGLDHQHARGMQRLAGEGRFLGGDGRASRRVNQKVVPSPGTLLTPMSPPINSTSSFEIARPSPVPPYLRVVEESTCEKLLNSRSSRSGGMPMPVSLTSRRTDRLRQLPFALDWRGW